MPSSPNGPTTREVALAAGVHQTTVSLALRSHPRIPAATREHIRAVAEKLGYRRDPRLTELMHHLRSRRVKRTLEVLAYVSDTRTKPIWHPRGTFVKQLAGARSQADRLGFRLDEFWLNHDGLTGARLNRILRARGIRGLLIGPVSDERILGGLDWERYAVVTLNHGLRSPELHRVGSNHVETVGAALEMLAARGFTRLGLIQSREQDRRVRHSWSTAYHGFCGRHPQLPPLPICFADYEGDKTDVAGRFVLSWFQAERPEVVLTTATTWRAVLRRAGYSCPADYSYVVLDRHAYEGFLDCAGMDQRHPELGAIAANKLADCLARAEFGVPAAPTVTLLNGRFVDGDTLARPRGA